MKITLPEDATEMIIDGMEQNKYHLLVSKISRFVDLLYRLNSSIAAKMIDKK